MSKNNQLDRYLDKIEQKKKARSRKNRNILFLIIAMVLLSTLGLVGHYFNLFTSEGISKLFNSSSENPIELPTNHSDSTESTPIEVTPPSTKPDKPNEENKARPKKRYSHYYPSLLIKGEMTAGEPIAFSLSNNTSGSKQSIHFGDGESAIFKRSITHIYKKPGNYKITFTSTNGSGGLKLAQDIVIENKISKKSESPKATDKEPLPQFPGGNKALAKYLSQNLDLVQLSKKDFILKLEIGNNGSVNKVSTSQPVSSEMETIFMDLFRSMPKWKPAEKNGKKMVSNIEIPISIK